MRFDSHGSRRPGAPSVAIASVFALALAIALGSTVSLVRASDDARGAAAVDDDDADQLLAAAAAARLIDRFIDAGIEEAGVTPAGAATDAEFLRRVSLDIIGVPPTEDEVRAFTADRDPDKRQRLVERLLANPRFGEHFADNWGLLLFTRLRRPGITGNVEPKDWLADFFNDGGTFDGMARAVLTATGNTLENPALAYTLRFRDGGIPADIAGTTSRLFMGVQIQCAQCHDHPYESWTQGDFEGMAAFFNLVQPRPADRDNRRAGFVVTDPTPRQLSRRPGRGRRGADIRGAVDAPPAFLGADGWTDQEDLTRREALAAWITSRSNPWFSKAMVNRTWAWFFGRGLVHPVDDFRSDNPPTHPELFDALANGLAEARWDPRFLVRAITLSNAYQRSSSLPEDVPADDAYAVRSYDMAYARGPLKPLTADQVFESILRVTGLDDAARQANRRDVDRLKQQLFRQFVTEIDDDEGVEAEAWAGSISQGLLLMNGPLTQIGSRAGGPQGRQDRIGAVASRNSLNDILNQTKDPATRVRRLWLTALGREPTSAEVREAASFASGGRGERGWEDLFWALLNSSEFMSNH